MQIKQYPPGYAFGYTPANRLFAPTVQNSIAKINDYQRREQAVMRMFDRSMEINP